MTFQPRPDPYTVSTDYFEGPLDLLLQLIERAELDITSMALAQVTDQYLNHLGKIQDRDPAEVSAFLVIAARLVYIKSSALLPRPPTQESPAEEDPGELLARQLIEYRRYKQVALWLAEREEKGYRSYIRLAPYPIKVEPQLDLSNLTLEGLVEIARQVLLNNNHLASLGQVVNLPRVTVREKIRSIITILRTSGHTSFQNLLGSKKRSEIVVTFLAMLELVKRHLISASQDALFGEIALEVEGTLDGSLDSDTEFQDLEFENE